MLTSILFVLCYEVNLTKFLCLERGCIYNNLPYLEIWMFILKYNEV